MSQMPDLQRRRASGALIGTLATAAGVPAAAQNASAWPERTVRIVVNGVSGGTADIAARIVAEALAANLGKSFIVDVKAGGSGTIGTSDVLRSAPDGHTLLVSVNAAMSEVPHSLKVPFDPLNDIKPIAELWQGGLLLIANNQVPARNLSELVQWVKAQPKGVSYASYSPGTSSHIMGVVLAREAGIELTHVGYKGIPPALTDLMAGQIPLMFSGVSASLTHLRSGKIRAIAVGSTARSEFIPDVPTFTESGFPKMESLTWMGLWASAKVPEDLQERIRREMDKVLARPEVIEKFRSAGASAPRGLSRAELSRGLSREYERTGAVLKSIGYKPET